MVLSILITSSMHLKQLKLAGFKSFVDPTVVDFPSQLVAVVGPNGCGKSNIIDAVRWVLGESSAKNLRGESMADVIFNGSSHRKSLGQASVELIFDNSLSPLMGAFAAYQEIAIKRLVTRDGDSAYFLNGSRCRRRDITDLFLGTGASAKGYSIIGQGTISELIQAKPEELRVFLEEAAQVSRYKERRRETLQRMTQTRDYLARVVDLRTELEKQVQRLERQAKAAQTYLGLKREEEQCKAEIIALRWREFSEKKQAKQEELRTLTLNYEQQLAVVASLNKERTLAKEEVQRLETEGQRNQKKSYDLGVEIARLETQIHQQAQEEKRLKSDRDELNIEVQRIAASLQLDQEALEDSRLRAIQAKQSLGQLKQLCVELSAIEEEVRQKHGAWQKLKQEQQAQVHVTQNYLQRTETELAYLEQKRQDSSLRLEQLLLEQADLSIETLEQKNMSLLDQGRLLQAQLEEAELKLKQEKELLDQLEAQLRASEQSLHQLQDEFQHLKAEHAALEARQKSSFAQSNQTKNLFLEEAQLPRLVNLLQVEPQWQSVCEWLLNETLEAYVLDEFQSLWPQWFREESQAGMVVSLKPLEEDKKQKYPRLAEQIKGNIPACIPNLEHIYLAEHLEQAQAWLPHLKDYESLVTAQGCWLGKGWVKWLNSEAQEEEGLLCRQQKIADLAKSALLLQEKIEGLKLRRDQVYQQVQEVKTRVDLYQFHFISFKEEFNSNLNAIRANEESLLYTTKLRTARLNEQESLQELLEETHLKLIEQKALYQRTEQQFNEETLQYRQLTEEQELWDLVLKQHANSLETQLKLLHQAELDSQKEQIQSQQLKEQIQREQNRLNTLEERLKALELEVLKVQIPELDWSSQLAAQLSQYQELNFVLQINQEELEQYKQKLGSIESTFVQQELGVKKIQEEILQIKMQEQELSVRSEALQEALAAFKAEAQTLLQTLPKELTPEQQEQQLLVLSGRIKNLGAINLAAIEEFATENERLVYLEQQFDDLNQALVLLETAIKEIDKETSTRLEQTFNEVNLRFQVLFPRLFGGGSAQLELTCDNLLEAGIVVMAQPPGKKNSRIHLLSGGEKALTAVALVFAIFQLNPSPFCMLDEVDAPLDDLNVGRFCDLVKEM